MGKHSITTCVLWIVCVITSVSCSEQNASTPERSIDIDSPSSVDTTTNPQQAQQDSAPLAKDISASSMTGGNIRLVYQGYDTVILERNRGDSNELLIVTPQMDFEVGLHWSRWPNDPKRIPLDDGGELLIASYRVGGGTGLSSSMAFIALFHKDHRPAFANVWHQGYSMPTLGTGHVVENKGYRILGEELLIDFEYFQDDGETVAEPKPYTHAITLKPGRLVRDQNNPLARFASGYPLEQEKQR